MFETLSDKKLQDAYQKAVELVLDREFIKLLEAEIINRGLKGHLDTRMDESSHQ
ncbi:sporulation histidine kinase inhibitor Sda [Aquibacillus saliphilus]|uniref:sporulation histidine kinase inhibitor Sda n=1 Tax=Aquibacillus saliphilus TaxID=1909422 RepID=UPI001CF000DE|nr:sporulation histidine kinase inhibitor Sda [Aquibacillus saliphilus]